MDEVDFSVSPEDIHNLAREIAVIETDEDLEIVSGLIQSDKYIRLIVHEDCMEVAWNADGLDALADNEIEPKSLFVGADAIEQAESVHLH